VVKGGEGLLGRIPGGAAETTGPLGKPENGKAPGGGAPEVDGALMPGGALYPKGEGWPMGVPVGLTGATLGGNVYCGGPDGGTAGLESAPGGGPGLENGGEPLGTPGSGADEGKLGG
jgi:hypothetical protein